MEDVRVAVVDVDSILWDFLSPMTRKMRDLFPEKVIPKEFDTWECPESYFESIQDMLDLFTEIHEEQDQHKPFDGAVELLQTLREKGYLIHIASNRPAHTRPVLVKWLDEQGLHYDAVFADEDKTVIFGSPEIDLLIDDAPRNQKAGLERGFKVLSLEYKYNQHMDEVIKFPTLQHMTSFIQRKI